LLKALFHYGVKRKSLKMLQLFYHSSMTQLCQTFVTRMITVRMWGKLRSRFCAYVCFICFTNYGQFACFNVSCDSSANKRRRKHYVTRSSVRPSVRPFTPILRDVTSLLLDGFQRNLSQIFIIWVGIVEKVLKVRGQGHYKDSRLQIALLIRIGTR